MKEYDAKVRLNEEDGGKTGELDIMSKPPFDKGYFNGVTYGIKFKEPVFEAEIGEQRPHGEWITSNYTDELTCPICREVLKRNYFNNFCSNCGARMEAGDSECGER